MTGFAFTPPSFTLVNSAGRPYAGAVARFYRAGTSTPLTVYTTAALTTAHGSSVTADGNGVFPPIFIDPDGGAYKVSFFTSGGSLIQTVDNLPVTSSGGGSGGDISYPRTPAEIAASVTPSDLTYPELNIKRYGAVAEGNSTNAAANNTAFTNAFLVAAQSGGRVYVPSAVLSYAVTDEFTVPANCTVYGDGVSSCVQQFTAEKNIFNLSNNTTVEKVYLKGTGAVSGSSFAKFNGVYASSVRNISILQIHASDWQSAGVQIRDTNNYLVEGCTFFQNDKGAFSSQSDIVVYSVSGGSRGVIHGNFCFSNCDAAGIYVNANGYDTDVTISDNVVVTLADDWTETSTGSVNRRHGILVSYQGSSPNGGRTVVTGNVCRNTKVTGIYRASTSAPVYPCLIADNFVSKVGWESGADQPLCGGIFLNNGGAGDKIANNVIAGFDGTGATGSNPEIHGCIVVNAMSAGNNGPVHVTGNYCGSSTNAGIVVKNSVRNVYVTNNVCAYNTYNDIVVVHAAADSTCGGHVIADNITQRSGTSYYAGVYLYLQAGATPTYVLRNRLNGGSSSSGSSIINCGVYLNQGTSDALIQDNLIRNFYTGVYVAGILAAGRQTKPRVRRNTIHQGAVGIYSEGGATTLHGCPYNAFSDMTSANCLGYAVEVSSLVGANWIMHSSTTPSAGAWLNGDKVYSSSVTTGDGVPIGWVYNSGGAWKTFGATFT